ncbi:hypothetical protein LINPERHAP2_LOCUS27284 [Linum perenne]
MRTFCSFLTILNPPVKSYCNDIYLITHAGMGRWVMRPLHYDRPDYDADPTCDLFTIELHYGGVLLGDAYKYGHTAYFDMVDPDSFSLQQLNRMVEFLGVYGGSFEYLWLVPGEKIPKDLKTLHCDEEVRDLTEEVMVAGGAGQGELVVDGGQANNHLLALEYNVDGSPSVLNQATSESPLGPVTIAQTDPTTHLNPEIHLSSDAVTRPDPPTPPSSQIPPSLVEETLPTSRPSSEILVSPVVDINNNPTSPESPPGTSSSPAGYENNEAPDYEYSSEDDSFHADERELGDESSEYEQVDYSESEVDEAIDNVLRRRGNASRTTDEDSDGLMNVLERRFPFAEHRYCVRHLWHNMSSKFKESWELKNMLWDVAKSTYLHAYQKAINVLVKQGLKCKMMKRLHKQRIRLASYPHDTICPNPGQQLKVNKAKSPFWYPVYNGDGEFEVRGARTFVVKLREFSCACGAWQLSGIPCEHAIACITYNGGKLLDYVDPAFLVGTYTWAYTVAIRPLNDSSQWLPSNGPRLRAPTVAATGCGPKQKKEEHL